MHVGIVPALLLHRFGLSWCVAVLCFPNNTMQLVQGSNLLLDLPCMLDCSLLCSTPAKPHSKPNTLALVVYCTPTCTLYLPGKLCAQRRGVVRLIELQTCLKCVHCEHPHSKCAHAG